MVEIIDIDMDPKDEGYGVIGQLVITSPIGPLTLRSRGAALSAVDFGSTGAPGGGEETAVLKETAAQLDAYFAGQRRGFEVPLAPGGTPFQRAVWAEVVKVGWGERASYGEIAARLGRPGSMRAVGGANGRNPIPILIPCHRILGADGSLTGYGGGLPIKIALLELEGWRPPERQQALFKEG